MNTSLQIRVGLLGCGHWGKLILRDLVLLGCKVDVVAPGPESVRNSITYGANRIVATIADLDKALDGYVVAVPTAHHAHVVEDLLDRQRPIFVEKPLTNDPVAAAHLAQTAGKHLFVMDKWRYHPGINMIYDLVRSKELGELQSLQLRRLQWGESHRDVDPVWTLLPHDLSIVLHLLGHIPAPCFAVGLHREGWMSGITAHLEGPVQISIEVSVRSMRRERMLSAIFSEGAAMMSDPMADHILIQRGTGEETKTLPIEQRQIYTTLPLFLELQTFVEHLRGGPAPMSSAVDGALIVERIAQCRELVGIKRTT